MQRLYEETESEFTRNRIRAFMTRVPCKTCSGARLKPEILAVTIKDRHGRELNIHRVQRADDRGRREDTSTKLELTDAATNDRGRSGARDSSRACNFSSRSASVI